MPLLDAVPLLGPWRIKRDAEKYQRWAAFVHSGPDIFEIVSIRQSYRRKGIKGYARWLDGRSSAIWIRNAWPSIGTFVSAEGNYGHGEHHQEQVFYVNRIIAVMDSSHVAAARRHMSRMKKL